MSDPLSVSGSAVGIVSLGIQATQSLWTYYSHFKDQYANITSLLADLDSLSTLLQHVEQRSKTRKFEASEAALVAQIESTFAECKTSINSLTRESSKFQKTRTYGFARISSAIRHGSFYRNIFRRVAYTFQEGTLTRMRGDIDTLLRRLSLAMDLLQQEAVNRIEGGVKAIRTTQVASEIRSWLQAPDAAVEFHQASEKRHSTSGAWLTECDQFASWLKRSSSFLWLCGFAGSGKSVLCSTAIKHTEASTNTQQDVGIAYFFFTFNDAKKQDKRVMISVLVLQLADQLSGTETALHLLHGKSKSWPSDTDLLDCLRQLVGGFRHTYIFLDGLDESSRLKYRSHVLDTINVMRCWHSGSGSPRTQLHIFATSRDELDIRHSLSLDPDCIISMKATGVSEDIASFISQELQYNTRLSHLKPFQNRIEYELSSRANGVFRWAECQLKSLAASVFTEHLLDQVLQNLPETLDDTYERMLGNIPHDCKSYARQILTVLCVSKEPLTVNELIDAVAVDLDRTPPQFDPKRRLPNIDALQSICPSFTESYTDEKGRLLLRLAHFSVQQYLESDRTRQQQGAKQFTVNVQDAHALMASICLTILMDPNMPPLDYNDDLKEVYALHPLTDYAACKWIWHFNNCAIGSGSVEAVRTLFEHGGDFGKASEHGNTALLLAVLSGKEDMVRVLLDHDATLKLPDNVQEKALNLAKKRGWEDVSQLLKSLKRGSLAPSGLHDSLTPADEGTGQ